MIIVAGSTGIVDWPTRFKVAVGVAEGLQYLHHHCPRRIIHRDIKASNILLNEHYEPQVTPMQSFSSNPLIIRISWMCKCRSFDLQISDFGLAKWLPAKWVHHVVFPVEGTIGLVLT